MALTYAQKLAFAQTVLQILQDNKDLLKESGLDITKKTTDLENLIKKAVEADAYQEELKAQLREATEKAIEALSKAYKTASSMVEAMVGVIGKDNPLSKRIKQLREQMAQEKLRGKKETS